MSTTPGGTRPPHGTYARWIAGCVIPGERVPSCAPCHSAERAYGNHLRRMRAYGQWEPFTPAGPVRQHIARLRAAGLGLRRISEVSGVPYATLNHIVRGNGARPPAARVRPETAAAVLTVPPRHAAPAPHALVDAAPTRRILAGLLASGRCKADLAGALRMDQLAFHRMLTQPSRRVTAATARRAVALVTATVNGHTPAQGVTRAQERGTEREAS